uniref:Uncharacterized protein n=1 Tax=Arundo donax TaxID=35708 RepID=A0A0A9CWF3_ARUDO
MFKNHHPRQVGGSLQLVIGINCSLIPLLLHVVGINPWWMRRTRRRRWWIRESSKWRRDGCFVPRSGLSWSTSMSRGGSASVMLSI